MEQPSILERLRAFNRWTKGWAASIAVAVGIWIVLRSYLIEAFRIPSASMENTLLVGDLRRRARDPAHRNPLLPPAGLCGAAARRDRRVPLGRRFDAQLEHREARDWWAHRYATNDARHGVPQRQAARRAVCPAPRVSTRRSGAAPESPDPAPALLRRARHDPLPPDDPRLGPDRDPARALLGHGRQPRPVL